MASRFASISDEEVKEFTEKLENENTKKKSPFVFSVCQKGAIMAKSYNSKI